MLLQPRTFSRSTAKRPQSRERRGKMRQPLAYAGDVLNGYENYLTVAINQISYQLVGQYGYEQTRGAYNRLYELRSEEECDEHAQLLVLLPGEEA